jgi:pyruvate/2-oxoglutarate dehydrogenase complex dihydrolipoamide acyltransferase (E2) component
MSAPGIHNLSVVIGGIGQRAHVDGDALTTRHVLCVTVSANHELVDGAPLARFSHELSTLLERAEGLEEACATSSEGVFARERAAEG